MFESSGIDPKAQQRLAADLFNFVWELLTKEERTNSEADMMVHAAHASRFHWGVVGTPVNFARGEWQISRVYAMLGRTEPALHHAQRCLDLCLENDLGDFDLAFAYEALARGMAVARNAAERDRFVALAESAGKNIADADDRQIFAADIASVKDIQL